MTSTVLDRVGRRSVESPTAIGGDYLTEEQAAALRKFIERMHRRPEANPAPGVTATDDRG
jgi:hypothetical protein